MGERADDAVREPFAWFFRNLERYRAHGAATAAALLAKLR